MAEFLFFPQPEVLGFDGRPIQSIHILGWDLSKPFDFLGMHFDQDVGTLFFITVTLGVVGIFIVWMHKGRFGRRLTALGDSPAASVTLGVNPTVTKLLVFGLSAGIAGLGGALLGVFQGTASVQDFQMLSGLPYLLLLVVGGVGVVSGAVMGGLLLQSFTWLTEIFPNVTVLSYFMRIGPGLAGIGIGKQPSGVIPTVGADVRAKNAAKRAAALKAAGTPPEPPPGTPPPELPEAASAATPGV
jgi:branched-chain amino acid transport system permease protein